MTPYEIDGIWYDPIRNITHLVMYWGYNHYTIDCGSDYGKVSCNRKAILEIIKHSELVKVAEFDE